jgi:hypothetical protein
MSYLTGNWSFDPLESWPSRWPCDIGTAARSGAALRP